MIDDVLVSFPFITNGSHGDKLILALNDYCLQMSTPLLLNIHFLINLEYHCIDSAHIKIASPLESEHVTSAHMKRITTKIHVIVKNHI